MSKLGECEWSASRSCSFIHCIGSWEELKADLKVVVKR